MRHSGTRVTVTCARARSGILSGRRVLMTRKTSLVAAVLVASLGAMVAADVKFLSVYKHIDAAQASFFGKKVAALVISKDDTLRVPAEEALARELTKLGMNGIATYRIAPKEELQAVET